jgi:hypothetical protein
VGVVDREQRRAHLAHRHQRAEQRVLEAGSRVDREGGLARRTREPEDRRGRARRAVEQPRDGLLAEHERLEQLPHHAPRDVLLEHAPGRGQHAHPALGGQLGGERQERALAETGLALGDHHDAGSARRAVERRRELRSLTVALQELLPAHRPRARA